MWVKTFGRMSYPVSTDNSNEVYFELNSETRSKPQCEIESAVINALGFCGMKLQESFKTEASDRDYRSSRLTMVFPAFKDADLTERRETIRVSVDNRYIFAEATDPRVHEVIHVITKHLVKDVLTGDAKSGAPPVVNPVKRYLLSIGLTVRGEVKRFDHYPNEGETCWSFHQRVRTDNIGDRKGSLAAEAARRTRGYGSWSEDWTSQDARSDFQSMGGGKGSRTWTDDRPTFVQKAPAPPSSSWGGSWSQDRGYYEQRSYDKSDDAYYQYGPRTRYESSQASYRPNKSYENAPEGEGYHVETYVGHDSKYHKRSDNWHQSSYYGDQPEVSEEPEAERKEYVSVNHGWGDHIVERPREREYVASTWGADESWQLRTPESLRDDSPRAEESRSSRGKQKERDEESTEEADKSNPPKKAATTPNIGPLDDKEYPSLPQQTWAQRVAQAPQAPVQPKAAPPGMVLPPPPARQRQMTPPPPLIPDSDLSLHTTRVNKTFEDAKRAAKVKKELESSPPADKLPDTDRQLPSTVLGSIKKWVTSHGDDDGTTYTGPNDIREYFLKRPEALAYATFAEVKGNFVCECNICPKNQKTKRKPQVWMSGKHAEHFESINHVRKEAANIRWYLDNEPDEGLPQPLRKVCKDWKKQPKDYKEFCAFAGILPAQGRLQLAEAKEARANQAASSLKAEPKDT